jgi:PAS domain S-box-containing protein
MISKILVVEDSKIIREEICEILEFEGFKVICAENGAKGLKKAKVTLPNLIISDVSMPKLNGYQFLKELQKSSTTEAIPFIFLSGKTELPDLRKGMNMGADDYLIKPLNTEELIKVVKRKLKKQQVIQDNIDELVEENEYSLKEAGRMAKIGYWRYINQTDTLIWSDTIHEIYGTDPEKEVPEIDVIYAFFDEKSRNKLTEAEITLNTSEVPFDLELKLTNLKNEERWIRNIGEPLYNSKNEIIGRRGVSQDITEQKLTSNKIEKAEEMYRLLANNSNDLICLIELDNTFKYVSPSVKTLLGYEQTDFLGKQVFGIIHRDDLKALKNTIEQNMCSGAVNGAFSCRVRHKKNHYLWFEFLTSPVYEEEKISYFVISARDITQRMLAKQKIETSLDLLEKKEYSLKESSRMAKIGYWEYDSVNASVTWSQYLYHIIAADPSKNPISRKKFVALFDEKSQEKLEQATQNLTSNGIPYDLELKLTNLRKEELWIRNVAQPVYNNENEIIGRRGLFQDITDTKEAQFELELSKLKIQNSLNLLEKKEYSMSEASKMAKIGYLEDDIATDTFKWSEHLYQIFGFDPKKPVPSRKEIAMLYDLESQQKMAKATSNLDSKGIPFDLELKIINLRKEEVWTRIVVQPVYNKQNKIVGRRGVLQDITEQKLVRNKVAEAEEMYRILTDHSNDLICMHEPDGTFKYISPSMKYIIGYEQEELLNKKIFSILHHDDIEKLKNGLKEGLQNDTNIDPFQCRVLHKNGHFIWLKFLLSRVYKDNKISHFVSYARDITSWVLAKKEIQEYQTSLQGLTTEITLIEEKQKQNIASNIHDHLSQSLVISKMRIDELKRNPELKIIDKDLLFIEKNISEALKNSRKITYDLSPPVLYQLGIIDALEWLCEDVEVTHNIACTINSNIASIKLDDVKSILLYRSIQEVINNTIKYANATLITVDLNKTNLGLTIIVTDNGNGFNTNVLNNYHNHSGSGFGLFTIRERLQNIKGKFTISSIINSGTTVTFFIPLSL